MDVTRSTTAAAAKPAKSIMPENDARNNDVRNTDVRNNVRNDLRNAVRHEAEAQHKSSGYGLPCANCRLYYPANADTCPACNSRERVSPNVVPATPKTQAAAEPLPDTAVVEQEREAFLKEFKSQLFAAHAEVASSPVVCTLGEHHAQGAEAATDLQGVLRPAAGARGCLRSRPAHRLEGSGADYLRRSLGRSLRPEQDLHQRGQRAAQRIAQALRSLQPAEPVPAAG